MTEGDVVLTPLPQADGYVKNRPAVVLRVMPPHGDLPPSLIRLGFLVVLPVANFLGSIGSIGPERHQRLLRRLSNHLVGRREAV
jgi:mRNA interferase MazF